MNTTNTGKDAKKPDLAPVTGQSKKKGSMSKSISMPPRLVLQLEDIAVKDGLTLSGLIQNVLIAYVETQEVIN